MLASSPSPPRLLVVEHDAGIRDLLAAFLTAEGYAVSLATSPAEAYALLDEHTFHLVLTDLFSTTPQDRFAFVAALRATAFPTPVGVLTGWNAAEEASAQHSLAFLVRKPFDIEDLLASIAACLNMPLSPEEEHQAHLLRTFLERACAAEWDGVAALCTEDVIYSLPGNSPLSRTVSGKAAFCAYIQAGLSHFPGLRLKEVLVYRRPHGMAARYSMRWDAGDGSPQHLTAAILVEFAGGHIRRIGARTNDERLTTLVAPAAQTTPRVLLVASDAVARSTLAHALIGEGYAVASAASSEEALELIEARCFHLILTDLPGGPAHQLLRLARPTPVGILTEQHLHPDEAVEQGFAFCAPKPVDLADLLRLMQTVLTTPLSDKQQRQVELVRRFFSAIETADWETLMPLCHQDFVCYPPAQSKAASVRALRGALAYRAYQETVRRRYPGYHAEEELLYPHPHGIAARYRFGWISPEGSPHHLTIGKFVRFQDERISWMRLWITTLEAQPPGGTGQPSSA